MRGEGVQSRAFLAGKTGERLAARDWSATLGPIDAWPHALRAMLGSILHSELPSVIYWGPSHLMLFNDSWAAIHADKKDDALGRPGSEVWAPIWHFLGRQIETVRETAQGVAITEQLVPIERDGRIVETYWSYSLTPLFSDDGLIGGVVSQGFEVTAQAAARRDREAELIRLQRMFDRVPTAMGLLRGKDHISEYVNEALLQFIGGRAMLGKPVAEAVPEIARQGFTTILDRVFESGETYVGKEVPVQIQRRPDAPPEDLVIDFVYQPIEGEDGAVESIFIHSSDVTERTRFAAALRESEERLQLALGAASIGIWDYDLVSDTLRWDERCKAMFGLPPDAEVSYETTFLPGVHPEDRDVTHEAVSGALHPDGSGAYDVEYRTIGLADGIERWIAATGQTIFSNGKAVRFIGTVIDITARKRAEEALARSREALADESRVLEILNRTADEVAAELDLDRLVQTVTDAGVALTGAKIGAFFYNVLDEHGASYMLYALSGADPAAFEFGMPRATDVFAPTFNGEGVIRSDDITLDPRYGRNPPHHGMPKGHLPVRSYLAVPVTSRSGEVIGGLFFGHDEPGMFSERAERLMSGLAGQAAIGIDNARLFQAAQRVNQTLEAEVAQRTAALQRREAQLRSIFETSYQYLGLLAPDGTLLEANQASLDGVGCTLPDVVGRKFWDTPWFTGTPGMPGTIRAAVERAGAGQTVRMEILINLPAGERAFDFAVRPVMDERETVVAIVPEAVDLTERRRAEELLRQSQKMEAVGQLTGGIAHDFNNMLAVIIGSLNLMHRRLAKGEVDVGRYVDAAMDGAQRAASLTQRLLAFSRRQPLAPAAIDAGRMLAGMSGLLASSLGETVHLEVIAATDLWRVNADPNQLENAVLNLAVNARDAMPEGGRLVIHTTNAPIDGAAALADDMAPGDYVMLAVSDTGTGMAPEVLARAMEPFFTTKSVGTGTGLGLSQVFGFVRQSGGHVKLQSEPGVGTTVTIFLPRYVGPDQPGEPEAGEAEGEGLGHETVLVVEDEPRVRHYSVEALRDLGYSVIDAPSPVEALRLIGEGLRVNLLFTDVVMPEMTGPQLAERARKMLPELKVLYTTGYARDAVAGGGVFGPGTQFLQKPFSIEQLAAKVRATLDA